jgi:hypothetical protein
MVKMKLKKRKEENKYIYFYGVKINQVVTLSAYVDIV